MHTLNIFIGTFLVLLLLGIFIPYINDALDTPDTTSTSGITQLKSTVTYQDILVNILVIPVWTFGLDTWINLILLLPIRVVMLFALYYLIFPTKS